MTLCLACYIYILCRYGGYWIQADDLAVRFALGETHMTKLNIRPLTHVDISIYCAGLEYIALLNQYIAWNWLKWAELTCYLNLLGGY